MIGLIKALNVTIIDLILFYSRMSKVEEVTLGRTKGLNMKKLCLLFTILFVSVLCTACINNFAVQELNGKAKELLESGNTEAAICRLQSSVDLDGNIFESRYNLAVAYIANEEYQKAEDQLLVAIKIKENNPNSYYSLGIAREGLAEGIINKKPEKKEVEVEASQEGEEVIISEKRKLSSDDMNEIISKMSQAAEAYEQYLTLKPDAEDKAEVNVQIETLKKSIADYQQKLSATPTDAENTVE